VKICAQGLLDYLTLPAAGHPAGLGERIADLDRKARSNLHVALWGPAPSSFLGALIDIFFRHDASVNIIASYCNYGKEQSRVAFSAGG
jgi:hypothetical protein